MASSAGLAMAQPPPVAASRPAAKWTLRVRQLICLPDAWGAPIFAQSGVLQHHQRMSPPVFISYARRASQAGARALRDALAAEGIEVFLDERDIALGAPFPAGIAGGLMGSRVVVLFASEAYFQRPWCVHELRLASAPWRHGRDPALDGVVVALPTASDLQAITAQLPPPLAASSWPLASDTEALAALVQVRLARRPSSFAEDWQDLNDDALRAARQGADQPLAWAGDAAAAPTSAGVFIGLSDMPSPRGEGFVGRAAALWQLVHELDTARAFTPARHVVVQGLGGSGKSLLAAEFVARHGARAFPAGIVWIDAARGAEALLTAGLLLWQHLAPGEAVPVAEDMPAARRWQALSAALAQRLVQNVPAGRLLWVVDGLPEPGAGEDLAPGGLAGWCPAPRHLSVLVTTRRADSLRDTDATLSLAPLADHDALTLLIRPPVDADWLTPAEWQAIIRWAGALPLVLALLRESLLGGGLSLQALRDAPKREAAAETSRVMDALRGEVDDRSLRGAAEAFALSWRALADVPGLQAAAQRLALLAAAPIDDLLLGAVAGDDAAGRLVRRGWLQPAGLAAVADATPVTTQRIFRLHPVPASVLRSTLTAPAEAFDAVLGALRETIVLAGGGALARRREGHLMRVLDRLFARPSPWPEAGPALAACVQRFSCAAASRSEPRSLRYLAACAADAAGVGDAMVEALRAATDSGDDAARAALPHTLQALASSAAAMAWLGELMADAAPIVRQMARVHAPAHPALLPAVFESAVADAGDATVHDSVALQARFTEGPLLRDALSLAARALAQDARPAARVLAAGLVGRVLDQHGRQFTAGGFQAPPLILRLVALALDDGDAGVRRACADAAGCGEAPFADGAWPRFVQAVNSAADDMARGRALEAAGHFLQQTRLPRPPQAPTVERDEDGALRLQVQLGASGSHWPSQVVPQLADWAAALPDAAARHAAARVLLGDDQGPAELGAWVYDHLEAGRTAPVRALADALLDCGVRHRALVNVHWWRAQTSHALGDAGTALDDLEVVVQHMPGFGPARERLLALRQHEAEAAIAAGDTTATIAHARRAVELAPEQPVVHYLLAIGLFNQDLLADAEDSADRALTLQPDTPELLWLRGLTRARLGRLDEARADAQRAVARDPDEPRYRELLGQLAP